MSDVRAMLRSELASRKAPTQQHSNGSGSNSKKRKAATEHPARETKKSRNEGADAKTSTAISNITDAEEEPSIPDAPSNDIADNSVDNVTATAVIQSATNDEPGAAVPPVDGVDEDEWAAFERDVATPPATMPDTRVTALNAPATISAAPLSAEQLAVQAREAESTQARGRRDVEAAEEKEEAQDQLLEEFEVMESLEERVARLREKRERLRRESGEEEPLKDAAGDGGEQGDKDEEVQVGDNDEESDEDNEDDEDWSFWR